jgi:ABC-2 type transport system permease protein
MRKILLIGWKDVVLAFRDRAALILMLAAPFVLTVGLGMVTGRLSGNSSSGLSNIPIVLVNQDSGQIGSSLVDVFQSTDLAEIVTAQILDDPAQARQLVDEDRVAAAIVIPPGFSASIIPEDETGASLAPVELELYANPSRLTSVGVINTILEEFVGRVEIARVGGLVAVTELVRSGRIQAQDAAQAAAQIGAAQAGETQESPAITLKNVTAGSQPVTFDILAYMAPGMALMFLMFTVSNGGRTLLAEQSQGTLPRLLVSPISTAQVLGGKVFGIYLTGVAQMLILIVASTLLFSLKWGDLLGVLVLVLAAVVGAVGWGMLITALAKTPGQVSSIGSALMLIFGILGGSFISLESMPSWLQLVSKITPNAWGLNGFTTLALGGGLSQILEPVSALIVMGAVLFTAAVVLINRRGFVQR